MEILASDNIISRTTRLSAIKAYYKVVILITTKKYEMNKSITNFETVSKVFKRKWENSRKDVDAGA